MALASGILGLLSSLVSSQGSQGGKGGGLSNFNFLGTMFDKNMKQKSSGDILQNFFNPSKFAGLFGGDEEEEQAPPNFYTPASDLEGLGEIGKLLLQSARRSPEGIPSGVLENIANLLRSRGDISKREGASTIRQLGGSTGTTGSSLLADLAMRQNTGINQSIGEQIAQNRLASEQLKHQDRQFVDKTRMGGSSLTAQMQASRANAERGMFGLTEGIRLQDEAAGQQRLGQGILGVGQAIQGFGDSGEGGNYDLLRDLFKTKAPASTRSHTSANPNPPANNQFRNYAQKRLVV